MNNYHSVFNMVNFFSFLTFFLIISPPARCYCYYDAGDYREQKRMGRQVTRSDVKYNEGTEFRKTVECG